MKHENTTQMQSENGILDALKPAEHIPLLRLNNTLQLKFLDLH